MFQIYIQVMMLLLQHVSYSNGCNAGYTSLAGDLDEQNNVYPSLLHVFSKVIVGVLIVVMEPGSGWGNVTGGHKQALKMLLLSEI